jgi:outer membrane protein assembly factor BamB
VQPGQTPYNCLNTSEFHKRKVKILLMIRNFFIAGVILVISNQAHADWPQWGGPHRDFKVPNAGLARTWPEGEPKVIWSRDLGDGYGGIVESDGFLYVMHRKKKTGDEKGKGNDVIAALNAKTGKTQWEYSYSANTLKGQVLDFGEGPNSTPLIHDDHVFSVGFTGILSCLDRKTGKRVWSKDLVTEYDGKVQEFGYAASPIMYDGKVVVLIGGKKAGVAAFDPATGKAAWTSPEYDISYASPVIINVDGEDQLVFMSSSEVIAISPMDGSLKWRYPHVNQYKNNCFAPLFGPDNLLFVSSHTDGGTRVLKLKRDDGKTSVKELWADKSLRIFHSNAVRVGGTIYGTVGDNVPTFVSAIDVYTGKVKWKERGFPKANIVYVDDGKIILLDENGQLALAEVSPGECKVLAKKQVLEKTAWTVPTVVGTTVYVRDRHKVMALNLK